MGDGIVKTAGKGCVQGLFLGFGLIVAGFVLLVFLGWSQVAREQAVAEAAEHAARESAARAHAKVETAAPPGPQTEQLASGEIGILYAPATREVWAATTEADWPALLEVEGKYRDAAVTAPSSLESLVQSGQARTYPVGTSVRVTRRDFEKSFVKILSGDFEGKSGWVHVEQAVKRVPRQ